MAQTRTFIFRSRPEAVAAARKALDGFDEVLDAGAFYDASLCVSELVTNAVLHADIGPDDELRLDVAVEDGKLRVSVTDTGKGFTPPQPTAGDEHGWGLFIVDRLSTRWGVERRDGTHVWFEMSTPVRDSVPEPDATAVDTGPDRADEAPDPGPRRRSVGRLRIGPQATA